MTLIDKIFHCLTTNRTLYYTHCAFNGKLFIFCVKYLSNHSNAMTTY